MGKTTTTSSNSKKQSQKLNFYNKNDIVETPKDFYNELDSVFNFDFDPCPINPTFNGLEVDWGQRNFVNPPFSKISEWVQKAVIEQNKNKTSLLLITFRPNTNYWFQHILPNVKTIIIMRKGLTYKGYERPLPVPQCLVLFQGKVVRDDTQRSTEDDSGAYDRRDGSEKSEGVSLVGGEKSKQDICLFAELFIHSTSQRPGDFFQQT